MKKIFTSLVAASTAATLAACGKTTTTNTKTTTTEKVKPEKKTTPSPSLPPSVYIKGVKKPAITKGSFAKGRFNTGDESGKSPEIIKRLKWDNAFQSEWEWNLDPEKWEETWESKNPKLAALNNLYYELSRITQQPEYNLVQKKQKLNNIGTKFYELAKEVQDELDESPDTAKQEALNHIFEDFSERSLEVRGELPILPSPPQSLAEQPEGKVFDWGDDYDLIQIPWPEIQENSETQDLLVIVSEAAAADVIESATQEIPEPAGDTAIDTWYRKNLRRFRTRSRRWVRSNTCDSYKTKNIK